jgi:hypothetical protein
MLCDERRKGKERKGKEEGEGNMLWQSTVLDI